MKQKAFTLIELLVVIVIIGILATISTATFRDNINKARDTQRVSDITNVHKALQAYYIFNGSYPSTGGFENALGDPTCDFTLSGSDTHTENWIPGLVPNYINKLPQDPTGKDQTLGSYRADQGTCYIYASDGTYYILTAWGTVESDTLGDNLYRRIGFREGQWNARIGRSGDARLYCNYYTIGGQNSSYGDGDEYDYYRHSYTFSNITNCDEEKANATTRHGHDPYATY